MPHIHGVSREAVVMFPPTLDEYITAENPVRAIDTFVDQLDLQALGFVPVVSAETGRPAYHPGDLLKLYIYGYLSPVRSSRLLERETRCNVEVMWLLKKLTPDHMTIATFRAQQRAAIQRVFREFTQVCKALDLFGGEFVAIDGSKFQAVNSRKRDSTQASVKQHLKRINQWNMAYLQELDQADDDHAPVKPQSAEKLRAKIEQLRQQLEASGERNCRRPIPTVAPCRWAEASWRLVYQRRLSLTDRSLENQGRDIARPLVLSQFMRHRLRRAHYSRVLTQSGDLFARPRPVHTLLGYVNPNLSLTK